MMLYGFCLISVVGELLENSVYITLQRNPVTPVSNKQAHCNEVLYDGNIISFLQVFVCHFLEVQINATFLVDSPERW